MEKIQKLLSDNLFRWPVFILWVLFASNLIIPRNWGFYGNGDWDLTYSTFEAARLSVIEYGEWPSYQPWLAYGSDLNANPQAVHASVFFIPVLIFGTFYGYKISILLAMLFGLWGSYKLFFKLGADALTSVLMAMVLVGAPYFSRHIFEAGHSNFLYLYFLPFITYCNLSWIQSKKNKYLIGIALLLAQILMAGAPLMYIITAGFLITWSLGKALIDKQGLSNTLAVLLCIGISLLLSAWKILPVLDFWENNPRLVADTSGIHFLTWLQAICDLPADTRTPHQWHEISIGFPIVLIAVLWYYRSNIPNYKLWVLVFIPLFWISLGNFPEVINPWYFLNRYVPVFSSLRAPYRFAIVTLLLFSVAFVKSTSLISDKKFIYTILTAVAFMQTLSFNSISNQMVFSKRIDDSEVKIAPLSVVKLKAEEKESQFLYLKKKCFVLNAYEPLYLKKVSDTMQKFVNGAELKDFKPSAIHLLAKDSIVKLSLRYDENWKLTGNGELHEKQGLICIENAQGAITLHRNGSISKTSVILCLSGLVALVFIPFIHFRDKRNSSN